MQFLELFRKYISYHESTNVEFEKRKPVTIQAYNNRYNIVTAFLFEKGKANLHSVSFSIALSKEFMEWLTSKYSNNYSIRAVEICKEVLDFGIEHGHIKYHSLNILRLKRSGPGRLVYLTPKELNDLETYQPNDSMKEKARDLFILQCNTGLSYIDIVNISKWNLMHYRGRDYILKKRAKTKKESHIPYNKITREILERYDFNMHILSNVNYNKALKDIADDLKISKHLTTHVGRKTFAMISLNWKGYSMEATSKMLGITTRTAEKHYAQPNINLISNEQDRMENI